MRIVWVAVAALLASACASGFLGAGPVGCGQMDAGNLGHVARYFTSPGDAAIRDSVGIVELLPDAVQAVVTDPATCERVLREFERSIRGQPHDDDIRAHGWEYSVYEMGPYRALLYDIHWPLPEGAVFATGYWFLMIYELLGDELVYVGGILM